MPIGQLCEQMPHCTQRAVSGTTQAVLRTSRRLNASLMSKVGIDSRYNHPVPLIPPDYIYYNAGAQADVTQFRAGNPPVLPGNRPASALEKDKPGNDRYGKDTST